MTTHERPYLSLVIPAYNEASRIAASLASVLEYLDAHAFTSELIVVDDGSADATVAEVRRSVAEHGTTKARVELLSYRPNGGKGRAVRTGVLATHGRWVAFADADLATPLSAIDQALPYVDSGEYQVVVGSRAASGARIDRYQPLYRRLSARFFNAIRDRLVPVGVADSQCGFKLFDGDLARAIFARQRVDGFMFDVETIYVARRLGARVLELGVPWADAGQSKVRFSSGFRIVPDLLRIRAMHGALTPADRPG